MINDEFICVGLLFIPKSLNGHLTDSISGAKKKPFIFGG